MVSTPNNPAFLKHMKGRTVAQAFVKGGFPVLVTGVVHAPDYSVGLNSSWVDSCDIEVFTLRGSPAPFIEKKLTDSDWSDLEVALLEASARDGF